MNSKHWLGAAMLLAAVAAWAADTGDTALVTALEGTVTKLSPGAPQPLQSFVKLRHGDQLALDKSARLQLVYFDSGRQETWTGGGRLDITLAGGVPHGLADPVVKKLPAVMVKQIAKTPSLESQGRTGMMRLRSAPSAEDLDRVDENYRQLKNGADKDDLGPDLYRLSAFFEMRRYDRVRQAADEMLQSRPNDAEAGRLAAYYRSALRNAEEAGAN